MKLLKNIKYTLPFILFLLIVTLLWRGLSLHPAQINSPLVNKAAPSFELPELFSAKKVTSHDFKGQVTLLNVWASWCNACAEEHAFLLQLMQNEHIVFYGLDYKDDPVVAKKLLLEYGNPYKLIAVDQTGQVAIDWGVYGAPETFVIDKKGMIRYKHIGPITADVWQSNLKPLIQQLQSAPT